MLARYHSPGLGRFMSVDSLAGAMDSPQSWNLYLYARNSPLCLLDPDGREEVFFHDDTAKYVYEVALADNAVVQDTLNKYRQPGSPDLHVRSVPRSDLNGRGGRFGINDPDPVYDPEQVAKTKKILPESGDAIVGGTFASGEIFLAEDLYHNESSAKEAGIEEAGHADHAIEDPVSYMKMSANDQVYMSDGRKKPHHERPAEQFVQEYIRRANSAAATAQFPRGTEKGPDKKKRPNNH
jgi:hypothetical protein